MTLSELARIEAIVSLCIIFGLLGFVFTLLAFWADRRLPMATYTKRRNNGD